MQSVVCERMAPTALSADRAVPTMIIHEFVDSTSYLHVVRPVCLCVCFGVGIFPNGQNRNKFAQVQNIFVGFTR